MILESHIMADIKELWSFKSFRARIFLAMFPTALALVFGFLAFDTTRPYVFHASESYIIPPSGKGGDQMTVFWKVTHNRTCPGIVQRTLVDPATDVILAVYDASPAAINGVDIGGNVLAKTFSLPRTLQKGVVGYQASLLYTCNWLQILFPDTFGIKYQTPKLLFTYEAE